MKKMNGRDPITIWGIEMEIAWGKANAKQLLKMWEEAIPKFNSTIDMSKIIIYGTPGKTKLTVIINEQ